MASLEIAAADATLREHTWKRSKFNGTENIVVWPDYCVAASLGEPRLSDRDKLRHSGVDLVVFPASNRDWSAALDQLAGLLRG